MHVQIGPSVTIPAILGLCHDLSHSSCRPVLATPRHVSSLTGEQFPYPDGVSVGVVEDTVRLTPVAPGPARLLIEALQTLR